jgi:23S rRNA (cytosine1962-C5)-methyltransferase
MSDLELLDCGGGRRLERFGAAIVDRPAPAADWIPRTPPVEWKRATLRWGKGGWVRGGTLDPWPVREPARDSRRPAESRDRAIRTKAPPASGRRTGPGSAR